MQNNNQKLNPNYVTGLLDAESSFTVALVKDNARKTGWHVLARFSMELHKKDLPLLKEVQSFFGVGNIAVHKGNSASFIVGSVSHLIDAIIPHFNKYPMLTQKQGDFLLFKSIVDLMSRKEHLNLEGLKRIVSLRASLNRGLPELLVKSFPGIIPVVRPAVEVLTNIDPCWLVGFIEGEGCFDVSIVNNRTKSSQAVQLRFRLNQHARDLDLMNSLVTYLGCGAIYRDSRDSGVLFMVTKLTDIQEKILPLFVNYPLKGNKALDYADFCRAVTLVKDKAHLTAEGLEEIRKIKDGMNTGRTS